MPQRLNGRGCDLCHGADHPGLPVLAYCFCGHNMIGAGGVDLGVGEAEAGEFASW
ncbi:MAG: hypothetical protein ACE5R4_02170 [Armatimonadota bacterium]